MDQFESNFIHLDTVDSTNTYAIDYLSKIDPVEGFYIFSDYQTAGKGQYGSNWESQKGKNILISFIYKPTTLNIDDIFYLHCWISLAIRKFLSYYTNYPVEIKWPNDIYIKEKKICGILINNILRGEKIQYSVIGIGININQTTFDKLENATSLHILEGKNFNLIELIQQLSFEIILGYQNIQKQEFSTMLTAYNEFLYLKSKEAIFENEKKETVYGKITGVDKYGNIHIIQNGNMNSFAFGKLKLLGKK